MTDITHPSLKSRRVPLGWTFNDAEEAAMKRAMNKSEQYMQTYGRGARPRDCDSRNGR